MNINGQVCLWNKDTGPRAEINCSAQSLALLPPSVPDSLTGIRVDYPFESNDQGKGFIEEVEKSGMVADEQWR